MRDWMVAHVISSECVGSNIDSQKEIKSGLSSRLPKMALGSWPSTCLMKLCARSGLSEAIIFFSPSTASYAIMNRGAITYKPIAELIDPRSLNA
jgi:hypothetical protein